MTIQQAILNKLLELSPEKQQKVLEFTSSLQQKATVSTRGSWKSLMGALSHRPIDVTEEDISEVRREMGR